jgi:hypothetical protein
VAPGTPREGLLNSIHTATPTAEVADHQAVRTEVASAVRLLQGALLGLVGLMAVLLAGILALSLRAALQAQTSTLQLLLLLGSPDALLQRVVRRVVLRRTVAGWLAASSLAGLLLTAVAMAYPPLRPLMGWPVAAVVALAPASLPLLAWLVEVCNTWAVWLSQTPQALVWLPSWGWAALVLPCLGTLCAMLMQRGWLAVVGLACSALVAVGIAVPAPKQMLLGGSQPIPQRLQTPTQQWGDAWLTLTPAGTYAIQVVHDPRSLQAYVSRTVLPLALPVSAKLAKPFPIATPQPFLYATQSGVQPWQVVPLACQRPWQRVAQACWRWHGERL